MTLKLILGGLMGVFIGLVTSWLAFTNVGSGIGLGIAIGAGICGVLIAYGTEFEN